MSNVAYKFESVNWLVCFHLSLFFLSHFQVPLCASKIISGDVFILDLGKKLIQFNGSDSNKDEKYNVRTTGFRSRQIVVSFIRLAYY